MARTHGCECPDEPTKCDLAAAVIAAARAWRHGDAGEADWSSTEAVIRAVDAYEAAIGGRE